MSALFILETIEDIFPQIMEREDLFWNIVENSVRNRSLMKRIDVSKIINGNRDISKNLAKQILGKDNIDRENFEAYIEKLINENNSDFKIDSLVEKLHDNPYGVNTDGLDNSNVAFYFSEIWFKYLKSCINKPQRRNKKRLVAIDPLDINERIKKVIKGFKYIDEENIKITNAKAVKEKIDRKEEFHLFKKIETNVIDYFYDIHKLFIEEQETNDLVFEEVRRKIRNQYLNLENKTQHETFNKLVDWLMYETGTTDREAC